MAKPLGVIFGKEAADQIEKTVREHARRLQNEQPTRARWQGRRGGTGGTTTGGTVCPCGTTYARGSITSLDPEQGGEHANEYQFSIPFKWGAVDATVAYDSFSSWTDTGLVVFTCDGGDHTVDITMTVCESSHTVCGVSTPQAKMTIVTNTNDCSTSGDCVNEPVPEYCPQEDVSLMYICRNWHPLGTSTFEPVDPQTPTDAVTDCVICVSPKVDTVTCGGLEIPSRVLVDFTARIKDVGPPECWMEASFSIVMDVPSTEVISVSSNICNSSQMVLSFVELECDAGGIDITVSHNQPGGVAIVEVVYADTPGGPPWDGATSSSTTDHTATLTPVV